MATAAGELLIRARVGGLIHGFLKGKACPSELCKQVQSEHLIPGSPEIKGRLGERDVRGNWAALIKGSVYM